MFFPATGFIYMLHLIAHFVREPPQCQRDSTFGMRDALLPSGRSGTLRLQDVYLVSAIKEEPQCLMICSVFPRLLRHCEIYFPLLDVLVLQQDRVTRSMNPTWLRNHGLL